MKKIVLCIPSLVTAGAEKFVVDLAVNLPSDEYKVYVAITRNFVGNQLIDNLISNNVEIIDLSGKNFFTMTRKQMNFFREVKPDVVHANTGAMFHVMVSAKLLKIKKKIYTVHNEAKLFFGSSKIRKFLYKLGFDYFGFVPVAICESVKKSMINEFGEKYRSIPCVHNGVDIEKFSVKRFKDITSDITIINTGSMYHIKNQIQILHAFYNLSLKYSNLKLIILGDGVERENLQKFVENKNISNRVDMPGVCSNVEKYLMNADIYVSASLSEGLPLSMLEAMSCGLPIVTSDAGGSVDLVSTGINGIVFPKNESKRLEESLETLILSEESRQKYSINSRLIAEEWSLKQCVAGYEKLYE